MCTSRRQHGLTLIELIMFIVIVSVALAGVLTVLNITTKSSADPIIRKQALAIAEAVLEEVMLQPFTWCDPDDPVAADPMTNRPGVCTVAEVLGPETVGGNTDARPHTTYPFDNVSDYDGATLTSTACPTQIADSTGTHCAPSGYSTTIAVVPENLGPSGTQIDASNCWGPTSINCSVRITVTVTNGSESLVLDGYRARHSPNLLP